MEAGLVGVMEAAFADQPWLPGAALDSVNSLVAIEDDDCNGSG